MDFDLHCPMIDEVDRVATFYLWNLSGQLVGYQQYRPESSKKNKNNPRDGKYFTYRKQPTIGVWGIESLHLSKNILFITEGIFDACRITQLGYSAIAVLSCDQKKEFRNWLTMLNRRIIAVCDDDKSGKKLAKFGDVAITTTEHDLGDSTEEFVTELIKKFVK